MNVCLNAMQRFRTSIVLCSETHAIILSPGVFAPTLFSKTFGSLVCESCTNIPGNASVPFICKDCHYDKVGCKAEPSFSVTSCFLGVWLAISGSGFANCTCTLKWERMCVCIPDSLRMNTDTWKDQKIKFAFKFHLDFFLFLTESNRPTFASVPNWVSPGAKHRFILFLLQFHTQNCL